MKRLAWVRCVATALAPLLVGCDQGDQSSVAEQLRMFAADFIRSLLAAYLF